MKLVRPLILLVSLVGGSLHAASLPCEGTVEEVAYHANNRLMIRLSSMNTPVFICSPEYEWKVTGTTYVTGPQTCKAMYSSFLTAKVTKAYVKKIWFDGDSVPTQCNAWEDWKNANVRYFKI